MKLATSCLACFPNSLSPLQRANAGMPSLFWLRSPIFFGIFWLNEDLSSRTFGLGVACAQTCSVIQLPQPFITSWHSPFILAQLRVMMTDLWATHASILPYNSSIECKAAMSQRVPLISNKIKRIKTFQNKVQALNLREKLRLLSVILCQFLARWQSACHAMEVI